MLHLLLTALVLNGAEGVDCSLGQSIIFLNAFNPVVHLLFIFTLTFYITDESYFLLRPYSIVISTPSSVFLFQGQEPNFVVQVI